MNEPKKPLSKRQEILAEGLKTDLVKKVAHARKEAFNQRTPQPVWDCIYEVGQVNYAVALSFLQSRWKKNQRVNERIKKCITSQNCVFLTLTFRDDVLAVTTEQTRRRYVARALKEQCPHYVANIDFGNAGEIREYIDSKGEIRQSTAREHYHALVVLPDGKRKFDMTKWVYGWSFAERIPVKDYNKVKKYVTKLTAHALKDYGEKPRMMIYSRD